MTVDFGFFPPDNLVAVGNRVWLDNGAGGGTPNDGIVNGAEAGIGGVEVQLYAGTSVVGAPLRTTITAADGCYLFDGLQPGDYVLYIPPSEFADGGPLFGLASSAPEGGDVPDDDDLDENGQNTPLNGGISSTVINLATGQEPVGEPSRALCASQLPDENENMTVDFGFTTPSDELGIQIEKFTNGISGDWDDCTTGAQIPPGDPVTWTYEVTNTGGVSFAKEDIIVTDSQGEMPVFDSVLVGNDDDFLDPGETWLYKAEGIAEDVGTCDSSGVPTLWGVDEQQNDLFSVDD